MSSLASLSRPRAWFPKFTCFLTFLCFGIFFANIVVAQSTCSASSPCPAGCCSKWGNCGYGPDFCSKDNCVNNCNVKADCDPGLWGKEYVTLDSCPLNVCCSKHGFCGTTDEFCGGVKVEQPSCTVDRTKAVKRVVGYYESWSITRACNTFWPHQIPIGVYTHLNFAFAGIDPNTFEIVPSSKKDLELYTHLADLKRSDPKLNVMIAIGGWSFNDPGPTANTFSDLARSDDAQRKFIASLLSFMSTYGFDGVDLDWEYPGAPDRSGKPDDFTNFPVFMKRLRRAIRGKQLSLTLPASLWYLQHFDIKALQKNVDFFNIMTYDFHGTWDKTSKWVGPYLNSHTNLTEIDQGLDLLWRNDISPEKVTMGLAFYGRGFTATSPSCMNPGCTYESGSPARECSNEVSVLLNSEIDLLVKDQSLRPTMDSKAAVKILKYDNNKWATYDDEVTLLKKVDYARSKCLGGIMVWAVSHDTQDAKYSNIIAKVAGRKVVTQGKDDSGDNDGLVAIAHPITQCRWTGCKEDCPANWIALKRSDPERPNDDMAFQNEAGCGQGGVQTFCCPPDKPLPKCGWWSHNNGACGRSCPSGYAEIGTNAKYCGQNALGILNAQAACCATDVESTHLYGQCKWTTELFCSQATCDKETVAYSFTGSGDAMCLEGVSVKNRFGDPDKEPDQNKAKYCCDQLNPNSQWNECIWLESTNGVCNSQCPPELTRVAMDWVGCREGTGRARCCKASYNKIVSELSPKDQAESAALLEFMQDPVCLITDAMSSDGTLIGPRRRGLMAEGGSNSVTDLVPRQSDPSKNIAEYYNQQIAAANIFIDTFMVVRLVAAWEIQRWDESVVRYYNALDFRNLTSWLNFSPEGIRLRLQGSSVQSAIEFMCNLPYDNFLVGSWAASGGGGGGGGGGSGLICVCERDDCCNPDDSDCIEHATAERRAPLFMLPDTAMSLAKRGDREVRTVSIMYNGANAGAIEFDFPAYPSGNDWKATGPSLALIKLGWYWNRNCLRFQPESMDVREPSGNIKGTIWETDHKFEKQNAMEYVQASVDGELPLADGKPKTAGLFIPQGIPGLPNGVHYRVPVDFWTEVMNEYPKSGQGGRPIDLFTEALGSNSNRLVFSFLKKAMNGLKSKMWGKGTLFGAGALENKAIGTKDKPRKLKDLKSALGQIEQVIQLWEWHCLPEIREQFKTIIHAMREALRLGEREYKTLFGRDVYAVAHFDEWVRRHFALMRENTIEFAETWGGHVYNTMELQMITDQDTIKRRDNIMKNKAYKDRTEFDFTGFFP